MKKINRWIIAILVILVGLSICKWSAPRLKKNTPINENVEMQLVDATIQAKYEEELTSTKLGVRYKDVFNLVTFTGFEGFCVGLRKIGDTIPMYLNTMKDEDGNVISQWLNMGN